MKNKHWKLKSFYIFNKKIMANKNDNLFFKVNENWVALGNLKSFLSNYGNCTYELKKFKRKNIVLHIKSEYGIKIQILCSKNLSEIIREENGFPQKFEYYQIYKIMKSNGNYIVRITSEMRLPYNNKLTEEQNQDKIRNLKGNVTLQVKVKNEDIKPISLRRATNFDWSKLMNY